MTSCSCIGFQNPKLALSTFGIYISSGSSLSNDAGGYEGLLTKTSKGLSVLRLREEGQPRRRQNLNFLLIFVRDPEFAEAYLKEVLSDGDVVEIRRLVSGKRRRGAEDRTPSWLDSAPLRWLHG